MDVFFVWDDDDDDDDDDECYFGLVLVFGVDIMMPMLVPYHLTLSDIII